MKKALLLGATLGAALLTGIASGAVSGSAWARVTDPDAYGSVGLARGANGTLHVIWAKGGNAFDTPVNAAGKAGGRTTVVSGWASASGTCRRYGDGRHAPSLRPRVDQSGRYGARGRGPHAHRTRDGWKVDARARGLGRSAREPA